MFASDFAFNFLISRFSLTCFNDSDSFIFFSSDKFLLSFIFFKISRPFVFISIDVFRFSGSCFVISASFAFFSSWRRFSLDWFKSAVSSLVRTLYETGGVDDNLSFILSLSMDKLCLSLLCRESVECLSDEWRSLCLLLWLELLQADGDRDLEPW